MSAFGGKVDIAFGREDARIEPAMTAATEAYADLAGVKLFWL